MATNAPSEGHSPATFGTAAEYRRLFGRSLMVLTKLRGVKPDIDELCRITAVETISPSLWVTAEFLDGSKRGFRPETIRLADDQEQKPVDRR